MKKITAIILSFVMIAVFALPAFAADTDVDIPIVNVIGKGYTIKNADGTNAFTPNTIDRGEYIKSQLEPVLTQLPTAFISGDYSGYVDALVDAVAPLYKDWVLDSDGSTQTSGSYIDWDYASAPIAQKSSNYQLYDYVFKYDWRLSPLEIADQLDCYIERVCAATGAEKISLYGRCLGSNMVMAYLAKACDGAYDHPFRVQNLFFNTPPIAGYIAVGSLLSGSIEFDPDNIEYFANNYIENNDVFEDPLTEMIVTTLISVMNYAKVLGWGTEKVQEFIDNVIVDALPKIALSSYGSFPSYWSMISDKYFDKAIKSVFNTDELRDEYKNFIDKVNAYNELVSKKDENGLTGYEKILKSLNSEGVNVGIAAKYGYAGFPLFEGSDITGDVRGTATELSLGANAISVRETFSSDYLKNAEIRGTSKYIDPDKTVDASTCLYPETTWFEKVEHGVFPNEIDYLVFCYFRADGEFTVEDSEALGYSRYMELDENGNLVPAQSDNSTSGETLDKGTSLILKLIRILISLIERLFSRG